MWMDLAKEYMERFGAKEGGEAGRTYGKYFRAVAIPNKEKPKEEKEEEV